MTVPPKPVTMAANAAIPKINELGIGCRKLSERVEDDPVRLNCQRGVVRIALVRSDDPSFEMPKW